MDLEREGQRMTPTLEATQTGEHTYEVAVRPDHGIHVTLYVVPALGKYAVKRDPASEGHISTHSTFEAAAKLPILSRIMAFM